MMTSEKDGSIETWLRLRRAFLDASHTFFTPVAWLAIFRVTSTSSKIYVSQLYLSIPTWSRTSCSSGVRVLFELNIPPMPPIPPLPPMPSMPRVTSNLPSSLPAVTLRAILLIIRTPESMFWGCHTAYTRWIGGDKGINVWSRFGDG